MRLTWKRSVAGEPHTDTLTHAAVLSTHPVQDRAAASNGPSQPKTALHTFSVLNTAAALAHVVVMQGTCNIVICSLMLPVHASHLPCSHRGFS